MKVKVFYEYPHKIEEVMNEWLSENQNITVINMTQSQSENKNSQYNQAVITILYNE